MADELNIEWSAQAIADLSRFGDFLHRHHPALAGLVAREIMIKAQDLATHPLMGRPVAGGGDYRQVIMQVLNARYVFQYRVEAARIVMLRVFHGREERRD